MTAQKNLAHIYLFGKGTEINYKKALDLYTLAAEQGFVHAQNTLNRYFPKLNKQKFFMNERDTAEQIDGNNLVQLTQNAAIHSEAGIYEIGL